MNILARLGVALLATSAAGAVHSSDTPVSSAAVAKVNADWGRYDRGNKGKLTALEFGTWILSARDQDSVAQANKGGSKRRNLPAVKILNETSAAFARADADRDRMISPNELASFLTDNG